MNCGRVKGFPVALPPINKHTTINLYMHVLFLTANYMEKKKLYGVKSNR